MPESGWTSRRVLGLKRSRLPAVYGSYYSTCLSASASSAENIPFLLHDRIVLQRKWIKHTCQQMGNKDPLLLGPILRDLPFTLRC